MPFLGMRNASLFVTTDNPRYTWRPENWRETILSLYPNGKAPLTAILSMMSSKPTDDPVFHWFDKELAQMRADVTLWDDTGLSGNYDDDATAGTVLYAKMTAAEANQFKLGHLVLLMDATALYAAKKMMCRVTAAPVINGANSYVTLTAIEADPGTASAAFDVAYIVGSAYGEGADTPTAVGYDPTQNYNYTQIFRDSLASTRTAKKTRLRTGDAVKEAKRECLELHSIGLERAIIFGYRYTGVDASSMPLRTTMGLRQFITTNKFNFATETGMTNWLTGGEAWLDDKLEQCFRYGSNEKLALCGSGAIAGITNLAKNSGNFQLTDKTVAYGIDIQQWKTPFGTINLKTHPLFSMEAGLRNMMILVEPKYIIQRIMDDTKYLPQRQGNGIDGETSEFLTELGFELHFEKAFAWFDGIGLAPVS